MDGSGVRARPFAPKGGQLLTSIAFALLFLFVFSIPLENALVLPGVGTFGRLIGLAAFAAGILAVGESGKVRSPSPIHLLLLAFVAWASLTYFWTASPDSTVEEALSYVQLLAMVWLIWELTPLPRQRVNLMQAYLLGTGVSALGALLHHGSVGIVRNSAFNMNPNDIGLRLALSIPMALYLAASEKQGFRMWLYRLHMVLAVCALFLTASRGALVALCGSLMMIPLTFRKWTFRQKAVMGAVVVVSTLTAVALVPNSTWQRMSTTGSEITQGTMDARTVIWRAGIEVFLDHPFVGVGAGAFPASMQRRVVIRRDEGKADIGQLPVGTGGTRRGGLCDLSCPVDDTGVFGVATAGVGPQFVAGDDADLGFGRFGDDLGKQQADMATFWTDVR